jgi:hypothetical protein
MSNIHEEPPYKEALIEYNYYANNLPDELKNKFYKRKRKFLHRKLTLIKLGLRNKSLVDKYEMMMEAAISKRVLISIYNSLNRNLDLYPRIDRHYLYTLLEYDKYKSIPSVSNIQTMIQAENSPANESSVPKELEPPPTGFEKMPTVDEVMYTIRNEMETIRNNERSQREHNNYIRTFRKKQKNPLNNNTKLLLKATQKPRRGLTGPSDTHRKTIELSRGISGPKHVRFRGKRIRFIPKKEENQSYKGHIPSYRISKRKRKPLFKSYTRKSRITTNTGEPTRRKGIFNKIKEVLGY